MIVRDEKEKLNWKIHYMPWLLAAAQTESVAVCKNTNLLVFFFLCQYNKRVRVHYVLFHFTNTYSVSSHNLFIGSVYAFSNIANNFFFYVVLSCSFLYLFLTLSWYVSLSLFLVRAVFFMTYHILKKRG